MQYDDEKDYLMRMIKEAARVFFSVALGKQYTQVEPEQESKYQVSGKGLDSYREMIDQGNINEAENMLLEDIDYNSSEEVAAAILVYQYIGEKDEAFLRGNGYSKEEALDGLKQLAERAGYQEVCGVLGPEAENQ